MARGLAVVLSGGGAKGAFQVGVLDELVTRRGVRVDIVAGVSTGAIQALAVAQDDVPGLVRVWTSLTGNRDIYRERPFGLVGGLLGASSVYDTSPLRARLRAFADPARITASGVKLLLGVVSLTTGAYRAIDETTPNIADWVYASCAMPVYFPPLLTQAANGAREQWVDGGVRNVTPLALALDWNPRAVLVVLASPQAPAPTPAKIYDGIVPIGLRSVGILQSEVVANDTEQAGLINDLLAARDAQGRALAAAGVTGSAAAAILAPLDAKLARYRFAPVKMIGPRVEFSDTLEFDPAKIAAAIDAGRAAVADDWDGIARFIGAP